MINVTQRLAGMPSLVSTGFILLITLLVTLMVLILLMLSSLASLANETGEQEGGDDEISHYETSDDGPAERVVWDKVPLPITLPVGRERLVTFPANVRVGIPSGLATQLRTQSNQGTVYWLAHAPFDTHRIEVHDVTTQAVYLIDLKAVKKKGLSATPIEVMVKHPTSAGNGRHNPQSFYPTANPLKQPGSIASIGYVALTRYAAQQLYAPRRLTGLSPLTPLTTLTPFAKMIHRVPVNRDPLPFFIRGFNETIEATPIASWRGGRLYVTAVKLQNLSNDAIHLDPRTLRGTWRTATFHHHRLYPYGVPMDTTAVYVISDRPFHERVWAMAGGHVNHREDAK